jgi:hypothetical protein
MTDGTRMASYVRNALLRRIQTASERSSVNREAIRYFVHAKSLSFTFSVFFSVFLPLCVRFLSCSVSEVNREALRVACYLPVDF